MIAYRYGAREPVENAERVSEQIVLAHRYRNLLVEIERARRGAVRATLDAVPAVQVATALAEATPEGPARTLAWAAATTARKVAAAALKPDLDAIHERVKVFQRLARARCGAYWGTYLIVEQAMDAARRSGGESRFRRYDGSGRIAVQLQGGLTVADALANEDTRLRIVPVPDGPGSARTGGKREGSRRVGRQCSVMMRVGSEGRDPVWAVIHATFHRALPEDGRIKWAVLRRERVGPDFVWSFQMSVEAAPAPDPKAVADRTGVLALDLGWRMRPDSQRVGYWQDDSGRHGEIVLPKNVLEGLARCREVGAVRDRRFNAFRDRLARWVVETLMDRPLPEWLAREAATLRLWRSADRLARLARRWARERFAGDEAIFDSTPACARQVRRRDGRESLDCNLHVDCWRRKDRHLHQWEEHGTRKVLGRRDELYRHVAATLSRNYRVVVIERFHLPDVQGRAGLGPEASGGEKVRADRVSSRRHAAAPGTFRLALVNACRRRGTVVAEVAAAYTTQDCADCGARNDFDAAPAIDHRCTACGATWDQDHCAARNILRLGLNSPLPQAFLSKVDFSGSNGIRGGDECLRWRGATEPSGHGMFHLPGTKGSAARAHRYAYETLIGPVPDGYELHHECETPGCVNVNHLIPVTRREHVRLSPTMITHAKQAQTHCIQGHPFDESNTYRRSNGTRKCRACHRERERASGPVTPTDGKALAGGKSARQQRFSRRRDRVMATADTAEAGCSQSAAQASEITGAAPGESQPLLKRVELETVSADGFGGGVADVAALAQEGGT